MYQRGPLSTHEGSLGLAPPPKLLRAIFIVWLRDEAHHNAATPDVLKSCAKLMKHQLATQESDGVCDTLARLDRTPSFHLVYSSHVHIYLTLAIIFPRQYTIRKHTND